MEKISKIIILFFVLGFFPISVEAATLSFSQNNSSYTVGQTFSVNLYTNSSDQSMNAVSGVVSFPSDKLQVVSISKAGSILSLWAEEPSFSNSAGTVSFEGIVLNPGFTGANGKILVINFRAKAVGQANLRLSLGAVLANDGTGSNILTGMGTASIQVSPAKIIESEPVPVNEEDPVEDIVPTEPVIEVQPIIVPRFEPVALVTPDTFWQKVKNALDNIIETPSLLLLFLLLIFLLLGFIFHKVSNKQTKKVKRRTKNEKDIQLTFSMLRGDLLEQLHVLEKAKTKRELTKEEENLTQVIESHLVDAEKFVKKSITSAE